MMLLVKSIMMGFLFPIFVFDLSAGPFHRVGAATGRPFRMLHTRMPSIFRSVMQSRYPC